MARKSAATTTSGNGSPPKPASRKRATTGKSSRSPKSPRPKAGEGEVPARGSGGHSLVIVESPKKARSINKFLGPKYVVKASMGHVRDLPKRKLGLDVAHGYSPSYEIVPAKKETVGDLKREAARADIVYLATDPDREGEAIAWHLQQALGLSDDRVRRVTFHEITERAVKEAFGHVGPVNMDMVNAQQARRFLDRFVGYQLSPLLWSKVARNLSAGRVQSVAVRLIVDREREIRAFVTEEFWKITATVSPTGVQGRRRQVSGRAGRIQRRQVRGKCRGRCRRIRDELASASYSSRESMRPTSPTRRIPVQDQHACSSRRRSACGSPASEP